MKGIPNLGNLMKQAQQFQSKFAKLQEELAERTVEDFILALKGEARPSRWEAQ